MKQPNGARFYRCALQVNPFAYHGRHGKRALFQNEVDYNNAIIEACLVNKIEAIAVTDHYRVADSWGLIHAARAKGIFVFGGFEAASKDGVHFLCLYDPEKDNSLERFIGALDGVADRADPRPHRREPSPEPPDLGNVKPLAAGLDQMGGLSGGGDAAIDDARGHQPLPQSHCLIEEPQDLPGRDVHALLVPLETKHLVAIDADGQAGLLGEPNFEQGG